MEKLIYLLGQPESQAVDALDHALRVETVASLQGAGASGYIQHIVGDTLEPGHRSSMHSSRKTSPPQPWRLTKFFMMRRAMNCNAVQRA